MKSCQLGSIIPMILFLLIAGCFHLGNAQQPPPPQHDPLMPLKHALNDAGAPALSSQQEDQLKQLVDDFHKNNRPPAPDPALMAAHRAYDEAVLAGDNAAAQAQANLIASQHAAMANAHLQAETTFKIQVVGILKASGNQLPLLLQRLGSEGVTRLLGALAGPGGPGGPGHGPGGPGFAPPPPGQPMRPDVPHQQ